MLFSATWLDAVLALVGSVADLGGTHRFLTYTQLQIEQDPIEQRAGTGMSIPLLIVDDSNMARKQVLRALPKDWDVEVTLAQTGVEALEAITQGKGEVVFLDLTMPELDGYGVLTALKERGIDPLVFVISADIQPEAKERVRKLGAAEFLSKPVDAERLSELLARYGLL